ncbi:MAG: NAD(P)-dependent oxidoreductase [Patescibacteria group bacterium]
MQKILLTGGRGFIGKNLLEKLSGKFNFVAPAHAELDLLDARKTSAYLKSEQFDIVIHAANIGGNRSQIGLTGVFEVNKKMFLNLAENHGLYGRMIFLGSGAEYGKQEPIVKIKENNFGKILPGDEYGKAKYFASEYIVAHPNIVNLRCFGVFGKYEDYTMRFISNAICLSLAGQPIIVRQNAVFEYIYINDLAKIIAFFIEHEPKEKFYNAGTGQGVELLALAKIVKALTQNPYDIQVNQQGLGKEYTCDNGLLMRELGDFKFTPIKQAIQEMIDWYKTNWQSIDQSKLTAYYF